MYLFAQELAEAALVYAERGAQAEYEVFAAAAELVPPEMRSQLDNLLPWQLRWVITGPYTKSPDAASRSVVANHQMRGRRLVAG